LAHIFNYHATRKNKQTKEEQNYLIGRIPHELITNEDANYSVSPH